MENRWLMKTVNMIQQSNHQVSSFWVLARSSSKERPALRKILPFPLHPHFLLLPLQSSGKWSDSVWGFLTEIRSLLDDRKWHESFRRRCEFFSWQLFQLRIWKSELTASGLMAQETDSGVAICRIGGLARREARRRELGCAKQRLPFVKQPARLVLDQNGARCLFATVVFDSVHVGWTCSRGPLLALTQELSGSLSIKSCLRV